MSGAVRAVAIGASAGAVEALSAILPQLPADYRAAVLVVVHIPPDKRSVLAELFGSKCRIAVREAEDKETAAPGVVYFAPPDYHLLVEAEGTLALSADEPVFFSRPSIDVLFETAADAFGRELIAILLTGANEDGARGLRAVAEAGGVTIVQNPLEAQAATMPQAALAACPSAAVMSLREIAAFLQGVP